MTNECKIRVLLVDNHPLVLDGLRAVLETYEDIEIVGAAANARAALELASSADPDVVLMDINMPLLNGIDAIELFKKQLPGIRILMLSMHDSREYISTSIMRGASGYVLKDVSTTEIVTAIHAVASGGTYFSSGVSEALLERGEKNLKGCPRAKPMCWYWLQKVAAIVRLRPDWVFQKQRLKHIAKISRRSSELPAPLVSHAMSLKTD